MAKSWISIPTDLIPMLRNPENRYFQIPRNAEL